MRALMERARASTSGLKFASVQATAYLGPRVAKPRLRTTRGANTGHRDRFDEGHDA